MPEPATLDAIPWFAWPAFTASVFTVKLAMPSSGFDGRGLVAVSTLGGVQVEVAVAHAGVAPSGGLMVGLVATAGVGGISVVPRSDAVSPEAPPVTVSGAAAADGEALIASDARELSVPATTTASVAKMRTTPNGRVPSDRFLLVHEVILGIPSSCDRFGTVVSERRLVLLVQVGNADLPRMTRSFAGNVATNWAGAYFPAITPLVVPRTPATCHKRSAKELTDRRTAFAPCPCQARFEPSSSP
jgi:hypothetical protein